MARLRLRLLGGFEAQVGSEPALRLPTRKAEALLAYLALSAGQAHQRDKLAALLWGDASDEQARGSLRRAIAEIRKALGESARPTLSIEGHTLALNPPAIDVDVADFERQVAEGTLEALQQAIVLYRGDLLEGLSLNEPPFEEWLLSERERFRELVLEALARLLAHQTKTQLTEQATQTALRLLALDPAAEAVHRTLMRLYVVQGRRAAALRQYQVCVDVLRRELGAEPEPETRRLYLEILQRQSTDAGVTDVPLALEAPRPPRGTRRARRTTETPLIGREAELALLMEALDETSRGHGRIAIVVGEAGIGKTRVLMSLAAHAKERRARVIVGRSYQTEQVLAFGPWVDAFRADQVTSDAEVLERLGPVWRTELGRLLPELSAPGAQPTPPGEDHLRLFESVAHLMADIAATQLVVMILEDIHWADSMSLRLLAFLGRRTRASAVLIVASAREEELAGASTLADALDELSREPHFINLTLSPLSRTATTTLVRALARAGSDEVEIERLGEQVWAVSEGNPFIAVEMMRALDAGTLPGTENRLALPESVRQIISGRLARLSDRSRQLLPVAAVLGREFEFALLRHAAELDDREAAEGLEELVRRRVLHGAGERFDFTHERIREVVYGELLPVRRKLLHARAATALEELYADNLEPHYAALGIHYRAGEVWAKAVTYSQHAGAQAFARSSPREATALFEQALACLQELPASRERDEKAIDLRLDLRHALFPLGEFGRILDCLHEAESLAAALDDQRRLARVLACLTRDCWQTGDQERAIASGERALTIARALDDFALEVLTKQRLGIAYLDLGEYRRASEFLSRAVESIEGDPRYERFGQPYLISVFSRFFLVWCLAELGEFGEALVRAQEAVRIAEAVDTPAERAFAYFGVGLVFLRKGLAHTAIAEFERGFRVFDRPHQPVWFSVSGSYLGSAYALSGRLAEGLALLEKTVDQTVAMKMRARYALSMTALSEAYLLAGRIDEAHRLAERALEVSRDQNERGWAAWTLRLLAEIASHRDPLDADTARDHYRQALALATELGMRPLVAHCHLGLGKLYRRTSTREQADQHLTTATTMFREMDMGFWVEKTETEMAAAGVSLQ